MPTNKTRAPRKGTEKPAKAQEETRSVAGWESWMPTPTLSGVSVTSDTALSLTAVYACVNVIATTLASLPFIVYERLPNGGRRPDPYHPIYDLIGFEPNDEMGAMSFWSAVIGAAALRGNGYAEIARDKTDFMPVSIVPLDPDLITVKRTDDGQLIYEGYRHQGDPKSDFRLLPQNVLHLSCLGSNGIVGWNPIALARESVGNLMSAEKTASAAFGNSSTFVGMITTPDELDELARKNVRENFNKVHQGPYNSAKIAIVDQGMQFQPLKISLSDLQYMELRQWGPGEIARLFGVPPHKIGDLSKATFSNIEEQNIEFWQTTIRPWAERIESEVNRKLLTRDQRRTHFCEFNMDSILRGNSEQQADVLTKHFAMGAISVNGVCSVLGYNPIGAEGDKRYISTNLQPMAEQLPSVPPSELPTETGDPVAEAPPEVSPSNDAVDAVRSVLRNDLSRLISKECQAVRRAAKKADFPAWQDTFYPEHRAKLAEAIEPTFRALSVLTGRGLDAQGFADEMVRSSREQLAGAEDLDGLLDSWLTERAEASARGVA